MPGVGNIGAQVGRAVMSDQIVNVNSGEIWVNIDDRPTTTGPWRRSSRPSRLTPICRTGSPPIRSSRSRTRFPDATGTSSSVSTAPTERPSRQGG